MNNGTSGGRFRPPVPGWLAAVTAAPKAGAAQNTTAQLDAYAQCMRAHGEPNFYLSTSTASPSPGAPGSASHPVLKLGPGVTVPGVDAGPPEYVAADKVCQHLAPAIGKAPTAQQAEQMLRRLVKDAACMRTHGYPDWPDPTIANGHFVNDPVPPGMDINSPQFHAANKACGAV